MKSHRLILPTRSFITNPHLIFFWRFLYRQSLPICLSERYSESQPIRSRIWLCFIPCQLQVKLTGTLGWLSGAWRTLALGFQCVYFCVNNLDDLRGLCSMPGDADFHRLVTPHYTRMVFPCLLTLGWSLCLCFVHCPHYQIGMATLMERKKPALLWRTTFYVVLSGLYSGVCSSGLLKIQWEKEQNLADCTVVCSVLVLQFGV